jgi:hypothetical protein
MEIGLKWLIDEELDAYVEESRQFNAASKAVVGPTTVEELRQARDRQATSLTPSGNRATQHTAEAGGRRVPVRITVPRETEIRGA